MLKQEARGYAPCKYVGIPLSKVLDEMSGRYADHPFQIPCRANMSIGMEKRLAIIARIS